MNTKVTLSDKEQEFMICLMAVDPESIWGLAIQNVVKDPEPMKFRRLVCDLKSQAHDNEQVMISILGKPCYDKLIAL